MFVVIVFRRSLWAWFFLFLLPNTSTHYAFLTPLLGAWLFCRGNKSLAGGALVLGGCLLAAVSVWPAADLRPSAVMPADPVVRGIYELFWNSISVQPAFRLPPIWNGVVSPLTAIPLGLVPLVLGASGLRARREDVLLFLSAYALLFGFGIGAYLCFPRHLGIAVVIFIGLLWSQVEDGIKLNFSSLTWLVMMALSGLVFLIGGLVYSFSAANGLAAFARATDLDRLPWASVMGYDGTDYSGRTGQPTLNLQKGCWNTFQIWNYEAGTPPAPSILTTRLHRLSTLPDGAVVISEVPLPPEAGARELARFVGAMTEQTLIVSRLPHQAGVAAPFPDCRAQGWGRSLRGGRIGSSDAGLPAKAAAR